MKKTCKNCGFTPCPHRKTIGEKNKIITYPCWQKKKNINGDEMKNEKIILQTPSYGVSGAFGYRIVFENRNNAIWFRVNDMGKWKLSKYESLKDAEWGEYLRSGAKSVPSTPQ